MGEGVYEGRYMTLEKEAEAFISGRQKQFRAGLQEGVKNLRQYIVDNLHSTEEKHEALKNLVEVQMWAERSAAIHGIKK
jgi:hypothetical protein